MAFVRAYIITVQSTKDMSVSISQEGYNEFEQAKRFVNSRSDKPEAMSEYRYVSDDYIYLIVEVRIIE